MATSSASGPPGSLLTHHHATRSTDWLVVERLGATNVVVMPLGQWRPSSLGDHVRMEGREQRADRFVAGKPRPFVPQQLDGGQVASEVVENEFWKEGRNSSSIQPDR